MMARLCNYSAYAMESSNSGNHLAESNSLAGLSPIASVTPSKAHHDWRCLSEGVKFDRFACTICHQEHLIGAEEAEQGLPLVGCVQQ